MNYTLKFVLVSKVLVLPILCQISIDIGIGNTFKSKYWYWYSQYFYKVLLTTLDFSSFIVKIVQNTTNLGTLSPF